MANEGTIQIELQEKGEHVIIDVTDTGCGVPKSNQKTIFQPGFSTKKRGWGLGLSLVQRIVEIYHGGKIFIKWSEIGKGIEIPKTKAFSSVSLNLLTPPPMEISGTDLDFSNFAAALFLAISVSQRAN